MKKHILNIFVILLLTGCGAQEDNIIQQGKGTDTSTELTSEMTEATTEIITENVASEDAPYNEPVNAEKYFEENADIQETVNAAESDSVRTEAQAIEDFSERGFTQYPITYDYSMDGTYVGESQAADSNNIHPIYQTSYVSSNNELWTVMEINGQFITMSVSYNAESDREAQLIISESDIITSYDSSTNTYYRTVPNETELIVKTVNNINAETLDSLTVDVLKDM